MGEDILFGSMGGAIAGFIFQTVTSLRNQSHQRQVEMIELAMKRVSIEDTSADKAGKRDGEGGVWMRRFILFMLAFTLCFGCFVFAFMPSVPVVIEDTVRGGGWLWGLVPEWSEKKFTNVNGFYIPQEFKTAFISLIFFYFGRSAGR